MSGPDVATLRESDARARRLACTEFERPLVVEAGAGTGKTATLTARALAWCVGPGWERQRGDAAARASALLS
ncbi:MAG: UvrD-helicase domain-containing protein, partial [Acidobacteriota bacterium]